MKIEIEIGEVQAACLWANATWWGRYHQPLEQIVSGLVTTEADRYLTASRELTISPEARQNLVKGYREAMAAHAAIKKGNTQ